MYALTESGRQELDLYSDADVDDLRLTRRTMMIPVMEAIDAGQGGSFGLLQDTTGFSRYEMTGLLRALYGRGFIERIEPGPGASSAEKRSWYMYQFGQSRGPKPESRTKEQFDAATARTMERYPEHSQARLDEYDRDLQKWYWERRGGRSAYERNRRQKKGLEE